MSIFSRCLRCLKEEKLFVSFIFSFLTALFLRHLTFLPFNPIVDVLFSNEQVQAASIDHFDSKNFTVEHNYPVTEFSRRQSNKRPLRGTTLPTSKKLIVLLWTDFFSENDWELETNFPYGFYRLEGEDCPPVPNCYLTRDRSYLNEASAVVFHFRNLELSDRPKWRVPNQFWVFALFESAVRTYSDFYITSRTTKQLLATDYRNFFNWTMTYRLDSDIPLFYGEFRRKSTPDPVPSHRKSTFSSKTRTAVMLCSNCDTHSQRMEYVRELQRYIDVDVVGSCSDSQSSHIADLFCRSKLTQDECAAFLRDTYKFYLAFENSLCGDYVTEKFFRGASFDLIPVVLNGAVNMSRFAPPHSYINARDFASPKQLAQHLDRIGRNKTLYESYLWWKPYYWVNFRFSTNKAFCGLCSKLNLAVEQPAKYAKVYEDIDGWWMKGAGGCRPGILWPNQGFRNLLERILISLIAGIVILVGARLFLKLRLWRQGR